jgi:hypothetical protein
MSVHHVVDHVLEVRACFIMHAPSSIHKLQTTFLDELPHCILYLVSLLLIPHSKELHFDIGKFAVWVEDELLYCRAQDQIHFGSLVTLIRPSVILINCFEPANIVMRVSNQMNIELFVLILSDSVVPTSHLFFELTNILWTSPVCIGSH